MAENLAVEGRMSVRSPMQWSSEPEGGFTTTDEPVRPVVADDGFSPADVNVAAAAPRRRLPAELDGAADPAATRVPRVRVGALRGPRRRRSRGARASGDLGGQHDRRGAFVRGRSSGRRGCRWGRQRRPSTCSPTTSCGRQTARWRYRSARTAIAGSGSAPRVSGSPRDRLPTLLQPARPRARARARPTPCRAGTASPRAGRRSPRGSRPPAGARPPRA